MSDAGAFHANWNARVATVLKSPWWSRAWIRQEFLLSAYAYFVASYEYMHWRHLAALVDVYDDILGFLSSYAPLERICSQSQCAPRSGTYWYPEDTDDKMRAERLLAVKKQGLIRSGGLLYHLDDMQLYKASDSKDLVYTCLVLSINQYGVQPDYSEDNSFEDVLTELARGIIFDHGNLYVLRLALLANQGRTCPGVLSGVPDWRQAAKVKICHVNQRYQTKTPKPYLLLQSLVSDRKDRVLRARGFLCETLQSFVKTQYSQSVFRTSVGNELPTVGNAATGDEVWMLYGADNLFMFTQHDQHHELVGEVLGWYGPLPEVPALIEEVVALTEANDPAIKTINIC
jgi:hypothetical protein